MSTLSTFSICLYNQIENVDIVDIVDNVDQSSKMGKIRIYILFSDFIMLICLRLYQCHIFKEFILQKFIFMFVLLAKYTDEH